MVPTARQCLAFVLSSLLIIRSARAFQSDDDNNANDHGHSDPFIFVPTPLLVWVALGVVSALYLTVSIALGERSLRNGHKATQQAVQWYRQRRDFNKRYEASQAATAAPVPAPAAPAPTAAHAATPLLSARHSVVTLERAAPSAAPGAPRWVAVEREVAAARQSRAPDDSDDDDAPMAARPLMSVVTLECAVPPAAATPRWATVEREAAAARQARAPDDSDDDGDMGGAAGAAAAAAGGGGGDGLEARRARDAVVWQLAQAQAALQLADSLRGVTAVAPARPVRRAAPKRPVIVSHLFGVSATCCCGCCGCSAPRFHKRLPAEYSHLGNEDYIENKLAACDVVLASFCHGWSADGVLVHTLVFMLASVVPVLVVTLARYKLQLATYAIFPAAVLVAWLYHGLRLSCKRTARVNRYYDQVLTNDQPGWRWSWANHSYIRVKINVDEYVRHLRQQQQRAQAGQV